ncbi:Phosphate-import permease protein PhnE [Caloramator mitchellensis]|uniref:Phosphate-import permease protein PhnE n=1 Tax=Caloramator mitchellensis TaxID=908809 RepID=A0A0R3JZZ1_CALMK|nr:ABC transporter permease subunit [Caloramator mitchellensis]KRQ86197.1 Phosphate-import permease protein PhnE [Caloramator mitchellensis]
MRLRKIDFLFINKILVLALVIFSWGFILIADDANLFSLINQQNINNAKKFVLGMLGFNESNSALLSFTSWKNIIYLTYETFLMSVIAIGLSSIGVILTVAFASRNIADGTLTHKKGLLNLGLFYFTRFMYIFTRAVPELLWAMIIIFFFKPGILPGALALALHNYGILGKLCSEVIENLDYKPFANLSSCGASKWQILTYGVFPSVYNKFLEYILYRFEIITRTTIVVGFVGAGGLGKQFRLSMSYFNYSEISIILICYFLLVKLSE